MVNLPVHSTLGASSAERWLQCGGSIALLKYLKIEETTDEPEYRLLGTAAHAAAAKCAANDLDAWEIMGEKFGDVTAEQAMADAIQVYLDVIRPIKNVALSYTGGEVGVEQRFHRPDLHKLYFGTIDFYAYLPMEETLDVTDYKHGQGIAVDVEWNPQIMYYAYGLLDRFPGVRSVRLRIVQPRGFHPDGPIREWTISAEALAAWCNDELITRMRALEVDDNLDAGPWCRFCPAKLVCPLLTGLFGAACKADPKELVNINDGKLGLNYQSLQAVEFYIKALKTEMHARLTRGHDMEGIAKLVAQKANRVFKAGAEEILKARLGPEVYTTPKLKGPAQIEELGKAAKDLVAEWAFTPSTGTTVALWDDKRVAIKVTSSQQAFGDAVAQLEDQSA